MDNGLEMKGLEGSRESHLGRSWAGVQAPRPWALDASLWASVSQVKGPGDLLSRDNSEEAPRLAVRWGPGRQGREEWPAQGLLTFLEVLQVLGVV